MLFLRETLTKLRPMLDLANLPLLIFVNKGIEISTHALTLEIIVDACGPDIARVATFIVSTLSIDLKSRLTLSLSQARLLLKKVSSFRRV